MEHIIRKVDLSKSYNDGLKDGYAEGYDRAIADVRKIIEKYNLGESKVSAEAELKPALHFIHQPIQRQFDKVLEEVDEAIQAFNDGENIDRVAEEVVDIQLASETLLARLGLSAAQRRMARIKKINFNEKRGYYDET
jgi:hypothetical protein